MGFYDDNGYLTPADSGKGLFWRDLIRDVDTAPNFDSLPITYRHDSLSYSDSWLTDLNISSRD